MFDSALNGITASVRCVSSIIVVLKAKLTKQKRQWKTKKSEENAIFAKHLTSIAVMTVHAKTSLYPFRRSMNANRNVNLWKEKTPIYRLFRSKAPKTQQICHYKRTRKTSEFFLLFNAGVNFSIRNNFANSGPFAKVSVLVHIYNSLL